MAAASVAPGMKVTASGRGAPGQRADTGDGKGMGGTGVVGIITGFGSICVNGQEIHYDGATPVSVDGAAASATGLTIGQLVSVRARGKGDSLLANSISVHSTLMGPVTWVSPKGDAFMALGQTVMLNQMDLPNLTRADASIKPGQRVRVSGLRDASGAIMATRVDKFPPGKAVQVTGPQAISPKSMGRIGELSISEVDKSQAGAFVQVRGRLSGEMLVA